jgi:hypothetical protein
VQRRNTEVVECITNLKEEERQKQFMITQVLVSFLEEDRPVPKSVPGSTQHNNCNGMHPTMQYAVCTTI